MKRFLLAAIALCCAGQLSAQDALHIGSATIPSGSVDLSVTVDNAAPLDAWSFAVCFDDTVASASALVAGTGIPTATTFYHDEMGVGFVRQLCLTEIQNGVFLPAGTGMELLRITFAAVGAEGGSTALSFCNAGVPQTDNVLSAVGGPVYPALNDGTFTIGNPADEFQRGDCNNDATANIADAVALLGFLFPSGCTPGVDCPTLPCSDACDGNDDGVINIADAVFMLSVLFPNGCTPGVDCPQFPAPGGTCGADATDTDPLDCVAYGHCP